MRVLARRPGGYISTACLDTHAPPLTGGWFLTGETGLPFWWVDSIPVNHDCLYIPRVCTTLVQQTHTGRNYAYANFSKGCTAVKATLDQISISATLMAAIATASAAGSALAGGPGQPC